MDRAPAAVHRGVIQQPLHRGGPAPGQARLHFTHLLGDVDVDWGVGVGRVEGRDRVGQVVRWHGAQGVECQADPAVAVARGGLPQRLAVGEDLVDGRDEPALLWSRGVRAEVRHPVDGRQQGEPDPGVRGGLVEAQGHLVR